MFLGGGNKLAEAEKKKNYAAELQEQIKFREEQKARDRAERLGLPPPNAAPQGGGGGGGGGQGGGGGPPPQQPMQQMGGPPPGMVMMDQGMPDMMMMQPQQMMGMPPQMMYDPMNMTMTMPMSMQQMMQQQMMQQPIMAPPIIQPPVIQPIIQPQLLQPQIQMMQPQMMGGMMGNGMMGNGMMQMPLGGLSQQLGPPMMQQQMMQQQMEQPMQSFMGGNGGGGGNGGQSPNESYGGGGGGGGGLSNFGGGDNGRRGGGKNAAQDQYRAELDRQMREREDRKKQEKREKMEEDRRFMDQQNANADQPRKGRGRVGGNDANVQSDNMGMARGYQDARQREASMGGPPGYGGGGDYGGGGGGGGGYGGPPGGGYGGPPGGGYGGPPGGGYGGPPPRQQEQWEGQQEQGWGNYGGGPRTPPGYGGAPPRNDSQVYGGPPNGGGGGGGMEFGGDGAPMNEKQAKMAKERAFQMELERQIEEKKRSKEMEKRKKDAEDQQDLAAIVKEREDAKKASDAEKGEALKSAKDLAAEAFLKAQQEAEAAKKNKFAAKHGGMMDGNPTFSTFWNAWDSLTLARVLQAKKNKFAAKRGGMVDAGDGPPYGPPAGGKSFDDKPVGAAGPAAAEEQDDDGAIGGIVIKMPKKKPPQPGPDGAQPPPVDGQQPPQGSQMGSRQESMMQGPPNGMMAPGGPGGQVMMDQMGQPMMGPPPGMYQPHLGIGGMHMGEEMMPHDPINMLAKEARSLRELVERQNADMYMLKQHAEIAEKNADLTRREMEILRVDMRRSAEPANIVIQDYTQPPGSPRRVIPARIEVLGPPIHLDHQLPPLMPGQRRPGGQQHGIASILDAVNGHGPVYTPPTPDRTHRIMSDERSLVGDSLFVYPDGSTPLNAVSRDLTPGQLSKLQRNSPARSQGSYAGSLKASREASDSGFGRIGSPGDMNINAIAARNREKQRQLANMNPSSAEALDEFLSNFGYQKGYISRGNNSLTNMPHGAGNDPRSGQSSRDLERERDKNKAPPELKHLNTLVQLAKLAFDEPSSAGAQQNKRRDSGNLGLASFSLQKQDSLDMEMRSQNGRLPRTASREMRDHSLRDHSLPNKSSWEPLPPLTADYRAQSNRLM